MALKKREREFVCGLVGSKHWREADARRALSLLKASGLSRVAFAREFGLTTTRLSWWERRLSDAGSRASSPEETPREAGEKFVELVAARSSRAAAARVRVGAVVVTLHRLDAAAAEFVMDLARLHEERSCW